MSVERVRHALDSIEAEANPFLGAGFHNVRLELLRMRGAAEFPRAICRPVHAFLGSVRVELERFPMDPHVFSPKQRQCFLEPPLPDEAPGADDIGNNLDDDWLAAHDAQSRITLPDDAVRITAKAFS